MGDMCNLYRALRVVPAVTLGAPRLLSVSALSSLAPRCGGAFPHVWCRREGRGRAGVRGLQGSRRRRLETFQVRLACSLMQVGDERGGWSLKALWTKGTG